MLQRQDYQLTGLPGIPVLWAICAALLFPAGAAAACSDPATWPASWIFCDDFESSARLVAPGRYFEHDDDDGEFRVRPGVGLHESRGLQARWQPGEVDAGSLRLAFGRNPNPYIARQGIFPDTDFSEIHYRHYLKLDPGWQGNPGKLSRATVFTARDDWRQAMIAHLWGGRGGALVLDPASCVRDGHVACRTYNDFDALRWLGIRRGRTGLFAGSHNGRWLCIEHRVRLNRPGEPNGLQQFWIDGRLEASAEGLDFVGTFDSYGINAIFLENYWDRGSPRLQVRTIDNLVVATAPIGCAPTANPSAR